MPSSSPSLVLSSSYSSNSLLSTSVLVAVRVRPFSDREKARRAQRVVRMPNGHVTELRDPSGRECPKLFTFDHSYWSHDGYREMANGYLAPACAEYVDQKRIFDDLGVQVLRNAWAGYNCALFAYGQTGSGKSYSIVGFGPNRGLVPMICEELFRSIETRKAQQPEADFQVTVSMLEIYCEKVRDLLSTKASPKGGLKVREHPKNGFYAEGLSSWPVRNYVELNLKINEGTRARTIAATNMNESSSRAHTIVRLEFTQLTRSKRTSEINLVDLAGSERLKQSGSEGDRLKEGIRINQSLSTLGRVIKTLHERQSGKQTCQQQIPYRDSVLTSLLRNALGGNSKTIMIATISPADIHYEETLSTLRFADQVKAIKTAPIVNESATERLVREMRAENARLQETLRQGVLEGAASADELEALRRQLVENQRGVEKLEKSWQQREEALKKQLSSLSMDDLEQSLEARRKETPHLWNLNEDPALSDVIVHFVEKGDIKVGNSSKVQIQLKGLSILHEHALLRNRNNKRITLEPLNGADILVNGKRLETEQELHQNDRIHFGGNHLYVFCNPLEMSRREEDQQQKISFELAQKEIARSQLRASLPAMGTGNKNKSKEELLLEEELVSLLPYVYRANSMAKELGQNVAYEIVLLPPEARGMAGGLTEELGSEKPNEAAELKKTGNRHIIWMGDLVLIYELYINHCWDTQIWVKVHNKTEDSTILWDSSRFMNRYYRMQELYQNQLEDQQLPSTSSPLSPQGKFVDERNNSSSPSADSPNLDEPIGTATVFLQELAYLIALEEEEVPIQDKNGDEIGRLTLSVTPCNRNGQEIVKGGRERLIGRNLTIKVSIESASLHGHSDDQQTFCKYRFFDRELISTAARAGPNPVYAHQRLFHFGPVPPQLVDYMKEGTLTIDVFASQRRIRRAKTDDERWKRGNNGDDDDEQSVHPRRRLSPVSSRARSSSSAARGTAREERRKTGERESWKDEESQRMDRKKIGELRRGEETKRWPKMRTSEVGRRGGRGRETEEEMKKMKTLTERKKQQKRVDWKDQQQPYQ